MPYGVTTQNSNNAACRLLHRWLRHTWQPQRWLQSSRIATLLCIYWHRPSRRPIVGVEGGFLPDLCPALSWDIKQIIRSYLIWADLT